jgi:agmatine/peptidylarginine deiminase
MKPVDMHMPWHGMEWNGDGIEFDAMNDFDSLIPTWNEMEAVLLSYPLQPSKWRQWLGTVGQGQMVYQIFTREHMTRLADYIHQQLATWQRGTKGPVVILEVNAQNERFSTLLRHALTAAGLSNGW